MEKLLAANAIVIKKNKEPFFSIQFQNYIGLYAGVNKDGLKFVNGWRQMLSTFSSELDQLLDEEISTIIRLPEYQHEATKAFSVSV